MGVRGPGSYIYIYIYFLKYIKRKYIISIFLNYFIYLFFFPCFSFLSPSFRLPFPFFLPSFLLPLSFFEMDIFI